MRAFRGELRDAREIVIVIVDNGIHVYFMLTTVRPLLSTSLARCSLLPVPRLRSRLQRMAGRGEGQRRGRGRGRAVAAFAEALTAFAAEPQGAATGSSCPNAVYNAAQGTSASASSADIEAPMQAFALALQQVNREAEVDAQGADGRQKAFSQLELGGSQRRQRTGELSSALLVAGGIASVTDIAMAVKAAVAKLERDNSSLKGLAGALSASIADLAPEVHAQERSSWLGGLVETLAVARKALRHHIVDRIVANVSISPKWLGYLRERGYQIGDKAWASAKAHGLLIIMITALSFDAQKVDYGMLYST